MGEIIESKKLVKHESGKEYTAIIQYMPSSNTHIITHKGDFKKGFFLKDFALDFTKLFGEPFISTIAEIPLFILIMIWILLLLVLILISLILEWGTSLLIILFFLGILAKELKSQFSYIAEYYRNTKCNKCGKEFICRETEKPDIREISTPAEFRIQATRYWECRSCGYINIRKNYEFATNKGKSMKLSSLAKIPCKICGETGAYIEYKKQDIIRSENKGREELLRRSYYRCKLCGLEDIKGVEFISYIYDDSPGPSFFIYDVTYEDYPH